MRRRDKRHRFIRGDLLSGLLELSDALGLLLNVVMRIPVLLVKLLL